MVEDIEKEEKHTEEHHAAKEQGILPEETSDDKKAAMEHGDEDEDVYSEEGREKLEEDDEIEPFESGFMQGASQAGGLGKDALTGEPLMGSEDVVETKIDGKLYRFVNEENAQKFREKKTREKEETL
jgi:hypothetical protein